MVTFTALHGYVNASVTKENMKQFESFFLENKMETIYFNCEAAAEGAAEQLPATGSTAKHFLMFVLQRKEGKINGKTCIFFRFVILIIMRKGNKTSS